MDKEVKGIRDSLIRMAWYMRGGMTIGDLYESTSAERELINSLIKDNLKTTKDSGLPFF